MLKITIPARLKDEFENEKDLLEELENGEKSFLFKGSYKEIKQALKRNDILYVLERINALTCCSKNGNRYIENKGFYKEYKEWLDFALKEIIKAKGINVKNDNDIYVILKNVNKF